jgi:hypothetical protein
VYESVPAEGLERAARFHAFFVEKVDQAPETLVRAGKGTAYQTGDPGDRGCGTNAVRSEP